MAIERDLLFTPSIYDSFQWLQSCPPSWKEKAYKDFFRSLTRAPWEPTKAIKRGMDFEDMVYRVANMPAPPEASAEFMAVVAEVRGAKIQKKIKRIETIDGQSFCLYGKTDAWFPTLIKDVKTTASYKRSKYLNSLQHRMYCYIEGISNFRYVVAVFNDDEDDKKVQSVELIDISYDAAGMGQLKEYVHEKITEFWRFIQADEDLLDAYLNKFCLY